MALTDVLLRILDSSYILKWIVSYIYLPIHKYRNKGRFDFYDSKARTDPEKMGYIIHSKEIELESPFPESHLVKANDTIFLYGVNSKSECLIVSIGRLVNQRADSNVYLKLANGKTYQLEYNSDFQQPGGDKNVFSCGGLQLYYLCPMRRWRIFFSGFMKETTEGAEGSRSTYVKFSLLWRASSDMHDNTSDMNDSAVRKSLAEEQWGSFLPPLTKLYRVLDFYSQAGVIFGTVCVDDTLEDYKMYLFGQRIRYLGDKTVSEVIEHSHMLGYVHKNGAFIHLGEASITNLAKRINFGCIVTPSAEITALENINLLGSKPLTDVRTDEMKAKIKAGRSYVFSLSDLHPIFESSSKKEFTKILSIEQMKFELDGKTGTGFFIKWKFNSPTERKISDVAVPTKILETESLLPMVVAFNKDVCQIPEITGGKGSSLGKLTILSQELQTFEIPNGIVVTTVSYKDFITKDILSEIRQLENVLYGNVDGDVKETSNRVCEKIIAAKIPNNVCVNITKNLEKIFGTEYMLKKFAVRSSATGEDTEQMSAAGQMDTYLGISGVENILSAVKKCWASQFGFIAIQYKRRYGQCLNTPMAVVIQEMVECELAGVMFTCNPVTGNPSTVSIAANYGLGESVVSGSEEPDSIELARTADNHLSLGNIIIGSKHHKIVSGDFGITLADIPENERQHCCISEENALKLGQLALKIEKHYCSRRDIEWGMLNSKIYIFQSRPVTSGTQETDFEIEHEFDGPLRVENEFFCTSNAGEVLPGAMSPLGIDAFFRQIFILGNGAGEAMFQSMFKSRCIPTSWMTMYNHAMFSFADLFGKLVSDIGGNFGKANMIAFFGKMIHDEEMFELARDRHEGTKKLPLKDLYLLVKMSLLNSRILTRNLKHFANYRIPVENYKTSHELFNAITSKCCDTVECFISHMSCTMVSMIWNMLILMTLSDARGDIDDDVYIDFANLVTARGDVESAGIPSAIQALAYHISKSIECTVFKEMKVEEAITWLTTTTTSAGERFRVFIKKHGHRCLMEQDIGFVPWGDNPKPLVQLLQNMVGSVTDDGAHESDISVRNLISQLKTPLGLFAKLKLRFFVPLCQRAVQRREASKSLQVKGLDIWRKAFRSLAKLMVAEGRLPDEDLLFFMPLDEVKELLNTRSPRIIAKAYHRQKLHPKMNKYIFPVLMKGFPRPLNESIKDVLPEEGYFSMKGVPVSQGVCQGYIRVALSLEDAADLKQGEILLAFSTDVAWTPYFTIISGVATELGGLISHGAVVSREYGLPCIVALHGATARFKTGDYVSLDGNKGILQKIPEPVNEL